VTTPARAGRASGVEVPVVLGVAMLCAGLGYPVTGAALRHATPLVVAAVRALGGAVVLLALLPVFGSRLPRGPRLWLWSLAIGLQNTTLTQIGISVGTDRAGAAVGAVISNSSPFYVALLGRFLLAERITRLRAVGLVVGFAGVVLTVAGGPGRVGHGGDLAVGLALAFVGAVAWAGGGLTMRALVLRERSLDVIGLTAAQFLVGGLALLPAAALAPGSTEWGAPGLALELAFLAIGAQLVVYVGFNTALARWPSSRVYAWTFLVPGVAVVVDAARGALPGAVASTGLVLVIAGVAIVNHPRAEPRP
jgi:drug/metabolite transporter (DMT)-like permease